MADWPSFGGYDRVSRALTVGDSYNKNVFGVGSGTAHVKGAWVQIIAACPVEAGGFTFMVNNSTGGAWSALVDIGFGASGSEQVVLPNLLVLPNANDHLSEFFYVPLTIPVGTRVSARAQGNITSPNPTGELVPLGGGFLGGRGFQECLAFGVDTATSLGTRLTGDYPGGWTAIADNVPELRALMVAAYQEATHANGQGGNWEIAYSAAGAGSPASIVFPSVPFATRANQFLNRMSAGAIPVRVPPNSKLWGRYNGVGYPSQNIRIGVYGFR